MTQPIEVDLPHSLGKDEARRRIANNIHKLEEHIPGGAQVQSGWTGDQLNLDVAAMGEAVTATIDVEETKVHLRVLLPPMLGMFAGMIQAALQKKGGVLLEDHRKHNSSLPRSGGEGDHRRRSMVEGPAPPSALCAATSPLLRNREDRETHAPFRDRRLGSGGLLHRRGAGKGLWRPGARSTSSTAIPFPTA